MKKLLILTLSFAFLSSCFLPARYYQARSLYLKSSYREAIDRYDKYLESAPNSAQRIQAEIERSDCYYQLGYDQFHAKNWETACRLLYLANSPIADLLLDDCYFNLAEKYLSQKDTMQAFIYFDQIVNDLPAADKVPAALSQKIKIHLQQNRRSLAFSDYNLLLQNYPQSEYTQEVMPEIEKLIPVLISDAQTLKEDNKFEDALQILLKIIEYPTSYTADVKIRISELYRLLAENAVKNNQLTQARTHFDAAIRYDPACQKAVGARLDELCAAFLKRGNQLLSDLQFDEAVATFSQCFDLIEDYPQSLEAIELAGAKKENYTKSLELFQKASDLEDLRSYKEALNYYKQAAEYYPSSKTSEKIFIMQNLLAAQEDPKLFAKTIVLDYKNGALVNAVQNIEREMTNKYGKYVSSSNWMVTFAIGQYKYEVRYDILSPKENFYFAWNVDIRTKKVIPSNKVSEKLMLDADLIKLEDLQK